MAPHIDEKVKLRTELLSNKLSTGMRSRIRLSEMDLKTVLHHGTIMVEKFYVEQGSDFVKKKSLNSLGFSFARETCSKKLSNFAKLQFLNDKK